MTRFNEAVRRLLEDADERSCAAQIQRQFRARGADDMEHEANELLAAAERLDPCHLAPAWTDR